MNLRLVIRFFFMSISLYGVLNTIIKLPTGQAVKQVEVGICNWLRAA